LLAVRFSKDATHIFTIVSHTLFTVGLNHLYHEMALNRTSHKNRSQIEADQAETTEFVNKVNQLRNLASTFAHQLTTVELLARSSLRVHARRLKAGLQIDLTQEVQRFEINLINLALRRCAGNQLRAAQLLGVKPTTLNSKIKRYKLDRRVDPE